MLENNSLPDLMIIIKSTRTTCLGLKQWLMAYRGVNISETNFRSIDIRESSLVYLLNSDVLDIVKSNVV